MLLTRWQKTLETFRDRPAIHDHGGFLRFSDIADALRTRPRALAPIPAHGSALNIATATLQGWRDSQPVLPIEKPDSPLPSLEDIPADVSHLKLTPGSEGRPRAILFTAAQIVSDADRLVAAMDLDPTCPNLATISLAHSYGFSSIILPMLLHGIPIQTVDIPFPAVVAAAWKAHPQVVLPAVPSMWRAWHRSGILAGAPIRLAISAGAPLALDLEQQVWEDHELKLHNFYGASECGGISFDDSESPRGDAHDLGTPLPGVSITTDPDQHFVVTSSSVALGYNRARQCERLNQGRFLTPDRGHLDGDRLILDAHDGDTINVAGRKLGPIRIEAALKATGLISEVRVFGIPSNDPERVDEVAALIPSDAPIDQLRKKVALAGWEIPRHWITRHSPSDWFLSRAQLRQRFRRP